MPGWYGIRQLFQRCLAVLGKPRPALRRYASTLHPRANRVQRLPATVRSFLRACFSNDLTMASHSPIMQYALSECKRLLHYDNDYPYRMETPNQRLRMARRNAGFGTAVEAADALGIKRSTYIGNENGHRGFPAKRAPQYARRFKVSDCGAYGICRQHSSSCWSEPLTLTSLINLHSPPSQRAFSRLHTNGIAGGNAFVCAKMKKYNHLVLK